MYNTVSNFRTRVISACLSTARADRMSGEASPRGVCKGRQTLPHRREWSLDVAADIADICLFPRLRHRTNEPWRPSLGHRARFPVGS